MQLKIEIVVREGKGKKEIRIITSCLPGSLLSYNLKSHFRISVYCISMADPDTFISLSASVGATALAG
jgi:hypothetical protein